MTLSLRSRNGREHHHREHCHRRTEGPVILAGILVTSDKGSRGERLDGSGPVAAEILRGIGAEIVCQRVVPDDRETIAAALVEMADRLGLDLVVTSGGTGLGPRDCTPEATLQVIDRQVPGLAEAMRREGLKSTPRAMLSRAVAGVRGRTLIVNLPGSPRGVRENLGVILAALPHAVEVLRGEAGDCARE